MITPITNLDNVNKTYMQGDNLYGLNAAKTAYELKPSVTTAPAVYSGQSATNQLNNKILPAMNNANQSILDQQTKLQAEKDAAAKVVPTTTPPPTTTEQVPQTGTKFIYKADGSMISVPLSTDATSLGYSETKPVQKPVAETAELSSGTSLKRYNDGTYGLYNMDGEYLGVGTAQQFNNAKNTQSTLDKLNQASNGAYPLTASQQSQIDAVKSTYANLERKQEQANANYTGGTTTAINLYGMGNSISGSGQIQGAINEGLVKIADLQSKMNSDVAKMTQAFQSDNLEMLKSVYETFAANQNDLQKAIDSVHNETVNAAKAEQQQRQASELAIDNDIRTLMNDAVKGGATSEQLAAMQVASKNKDYAAAVKAGGSSLLNASGIAGEYNAYKRDALLRGLAPMSFDDYQTRDANRKVAIASAGASKIGDGNITKDQYKVITDINNEIFKSPVYKTVQSAQVFVDGVRGALQQKTGLGDIAAINQFQKVVDEGAVTRDQDVKLVLGAQTVMNRLNTWKDRNIVSGEVMSENLRGEMKRVMDTLLAVKLQRLINSPEISSQLKIAKQTGIDPDQTVIGTLNSPQNTNMSLDIINEQQNKVDSLQNFINSDPKNTNIVNTFRKQFPNDTPEQIYDALKAKGLVSFNSVGSDTQQASIPKSSRLSYVNNNPGNLRFAGQVGATQGEGGFARFATTTEGIKALANQIKLDTGRGHTLSSFISKYAPPTENDTKGYLATVAKNLGVSPGTPLAQLDQNKLLKAIALQESGTKIS